MSDTELRDQLEREQAEFEALRAKVERLYDELSQALLAKAYGDPALLEAFLTNEEGENG